MSERITNLIDTLNNVSSGFYGTHVVLFAAICVTAFLFIQYIFRYRIVQKIAATMRNDFTEQERLRQQEFRELLLSNGEQQKIPFFKKVDIFLEQSGAKRRIPGLTAEAYLAFIVSLAAVTTIAGTFITKSLIYGVLSAIAVILLNYIYLYMKRNYNFRQTEKDITKFMNLLENVNYTETRLDLIFKRIIPYLNEPLKGALTTFCYEVGAGLPMEAALDNLIERVDHKKVKTLFKSFKICNTKEQNYAEIIEENRDVVRNYIAARKERESIKRNAFIELCIIAGMGLVVLHLFQSIVTDMHAMIFNTLFGQIIVAYMLIVLFIGIITVLKTER